MSQSVLQNRSRFLGRARLLPSRIRRLSLGSAEALPSHLRTVLMLLVMWLASGCAIEPHAGPVSLSSWQTNLEQYVWDRANGDPNVLRDMSWDDIHRGFAIISDPLPDRSTDAIGLLVAHQEIDHRPYFIFLFALIHEQVLQELRSVALNVEAGRFRWFIGAEDPAAFDRYKSFANGSAFPAPDDLFNASIASDRITVTHDQSGASWKLDLTASSRPSPAGPCSRPLSIPCTRP